MGVRRRTMSDAVYGVNIHIDRLNEAIGDGDSVFAWKEFAMGH
jgi:hypothetical protein